MDEIKFIIENTYKNANNSEVDRLVEKNKNDITLANALIQEVGRYDENSLRFCTLPINARFAVKISTMGDVVIEPLIAALEINNNQNDGWRRAWICNTMGLLMKEIFIPYLLKIIYEEEEILVINSAGKSLLRYLQYTNKFESYSNEILESMEYICRKLFYEGKASPLNIGSYARDFLKERKPESKVLKEIDEYIYEKRKNRSIFRKIYDFPDDLQDFSVKYNKKKSNILITSLKISSRVLITLKALIILILYLPKIIITLCKVSNKSENNKR